MDPPSFIWYYIIEPVRLSAALPGPETTARGAGIGCRTRGAEKRGQRSAAARDSPRENLGETPGKPRKNPRKASGKPRENPGKTSAPPGEPRGVSGTSPPIERRGRRGRGPANPGFGGKQGFIQRFMTEHQSNTAPKRLSDGEGKARFFKFFNIFLVKYLHRIKIRSIFALAIKERRRSLIE